MRRAEIVSILESALARISRANGFNTDFDYVSYWQDTPTQYQKNHLDYRDTTEEYTKKNIVYDAALNLEIVAVVYETETVSAAELGTLVLGDLIKAVRSLSLGASVLLNLERSHKYVETKGKTACHVELEIKVLYKF